MGFQKSDVNMRTRYLVGIVVAALVTAAYFWLQSSELLVPVTDYVFVLASGICSILAFLVTRHWGFRGRFGLVHLGLFLGVLLWFLGDAAWTIYETVLQINIPYPSFADVFYLAGYIPIAIGIVQFLWTFRAGLKRQRAFVALGVGLIFLVLTCVFLIGPLVVSTEDFLTKSYDVAYPLLDSMLVVLAIFMFFVFSGGKMAGVWVWISFGLLLTALADIAFSLGSLQGWYYSGHPIELIQFWGYISLALGLESQREGSYS
jgi:hypothetical protein